MNGQPTSEYSLNKEMHIGAKIHKIICYNDGVCAGSMERNSMKMLIQSEAIMKKGRSMLENIRNIRKLNCQYL